MRRRTLLVRSAVLAAMGLAGCTGGDGGATTTVPGGSEPPGAPSATPTAMSTTSSRTATPTDTPAGPATDSPTASGEPDQTVTVGPNGDLSFGPRSFEIAVGETVRWVWEAGGHNVRPSAMPDGADWPGTAGGDSQTFGAGHTYTYTFEVAGTYEYYCAPHRAAGMTGSFRVG